MSHSNRRNRAGFPRMPLRRQPVNRSDERMLITRTPGELAMLMTELPEHEALNRACISVETVYGLGEPVGVRYIQPR